MGAQTEGMIQGLGEAWEGISSCKKKGQLCLSPHSERLAHSLCVCIRGPCALSERTLPCPSLFLQYVREHVCPEPKPSALAWAQQTWLQGLHCCYGCWNVFLVQEELFLHRLKKDKRKKSNHLNPLPSNAEEVTIGENKFQLQAFLLEPSFEPGP